MAALVNQTNVNVDQSFFTPASSTLGAYTAATSTLNVSSVTFYGGGGVIQPGVGSSNVGLVLQNFAPDSCGPSTVSAYLEGNLLPSYIGVNALYFGGGEASINAPSTNVLSFNSKSVSCTNFGGSNIGIITSSINGTPLLNPNPRVQVLGIQTLLDAGGSTIVTLANTSTISLSVNAVGATPTIVPYSVYTNPAGSYTLYGDPGAVVSYVTTYLTV
jgi:hypothetical protein